MVLALGLRLYNLGFGLPSMYDPDEPLFVIKAVELLTDRTLNPRWFGHPGTTTIYLTSLTSVAMFGWGLLVGWWPSVQAFTQAAYADPALIFLPARFMMALIAVAVVWLTYLVAKQLHGRIVGLIAAAFLSLNSVHIAWSQVIRTDINASLFMLGALYFAARIARHGRTADYVRAGILTGIAIATKWPAGSVFIAVIGAAVARCVHDDREWSSHARSLALAMVATVLALLLTSPFLLLDWRTVVADLSGEARPLHLGHTGAGPFDNLYTYFRLQVAASMGWPILLLILAGALISAMRSAAARYTLLPATVAFLVAISIQHLIWARWILPAMPMLSIFAAVGLVAASERLAKWSGWPKEQLTAMLLAVALVPSIVSTLGAVRERMHDTRRLAADWATRNIPAGSRVVLEHLEIRLRDRPWTILFPVGSAGCIDGVRALRTGVRYDDVQRNRKGAPIVDLGSVDAARLESCRADYAILTYFDLYQRQPAQFPQQIATYRRLLAGGKTVALFRPEPGRTGGPTVRIIQIRRRPEAGAI